MVVNTCIKNWKKISNQQCKFTTQGIQKEEQSKPKANRKEKIITIKAEITKIENTEINQWN